MKYIPPAVDKTAFNCPHCGVLTTQFWFALWGDERRYGAKLPTIFKAPDPESSTAELESSISKITLALSKLEQATPGYPFIQRMEKTNYVHTSIWNLNAAVCMDCSNISVWVGDKLVFPIEGKAPPANPDIPDDIRRDYDEASSILDLSPRGAAALIRLAIQKLCKELGQPGKNINDDIAALVRDGLSSKIQKALDAVRVIGNEAVHPGEMDLRDDRATAEQLFRLLNIIATTMISEPKAIDEIYEGLPSGKLEGIENRDRNNGN